MGSKYMIPLLEEENHKEHFTKVGLTLLGGFQMSIGGQPAILSLGAQRVIALLALESRPTPRPYIAGQLWPDVTESRALGDLRSTLWRLRQMGLNFIHSHRGHLQLDPATHVDVAEVVAVARRLVQADAHCTDVDLDPTRFRGELLPDWPDEWLILERVRLHQLCLHAIDAIANRLVHSSRYAEAVDAALIGIASEPFRESAHRILIYAHLAEGNRSEAIRQYTKYQDLLAQELGATPSQDLQDLAVTLQTRSTVKAQQLGPARRLG